jgi:hypothetical protein
MQKSNIELHLASETSTLDRARLARDSQHELDTLRKRLQDSEMELASMRQQLVPAPSSNLFIHIF